MMMLKPLARLSFTLMAVALWSGTVFAQQAGGDTGTGTGTPAGEVALGTLDADTAFSTIDRGEGVGSTASTGAGFSDVSVAPPSAGGAGGGRATGGLGGFGGGGFGGFGGLGGAFGNLFGNNANSGSSKPVIRTRMRAAFDVPVTPPVVVQQTATRRFQSLATQPQLRGIQVTMQGRTAVISGTVGSDRDRRMSELLMRLEPGVNRVDNQVEVSPQSASDVQ